MKKLILASLLALSVSVMAAVGEGIGSGYKDEIRVSVETDGNKIIAIKVVKMDETKKNCRACYYEADSGDFINRKWMLTT